MKNKFILLLILISLIIPTKSLLSDWDIQIIDQTASVGKYSNLGFGVNNQPRIAYYDETNSSVKLATYDGNNWSEQIIDNSGYVGSYISFTINQNDEGSLIYRDNSNGDVIYNGYIQSPLDWDIQIIDQTASVGKYSNLGFGVNNQPRIAYYDETNSSVKLATYDGNNWSEQIIDNSGYVGSYLGFANNQNDEGSLIYRDNANGDVIYNGYIESPLDWDIQIIDQTGNVGKYSSIGINDVNNPIVSYWDFSNNKLKAAEFINEQWCIEQVDNSGNDVGENSFLAISPNEEKAGIVYFDNSITAVKFAEKNIKTQLTVVEPNGSESWEAGFSYNIKWLQPVDVVNVNVKYSVDGGNTWFTIVNNTENDGVFSWEIPNNPSDICLVKIIDSNDSENYDIGDDHFSIIPYSITVISPNGNEIWEVDSEQEIQWETTGSISNVKLEFSIDGGQNWQLLSDGIENDGLYLWEIPNFVSSNSFIKIYDVTNLSINDISNEPFSIAAAVLATEDTLDFGGIVLGETDVDTLIVSNNGNINLEMTSISVTGSAFSLMSNSFIIIHPDSSEQIIVKFETYDIGIHTGEITWNDNDYFGIDTVSLIGSVRAPEYKSELYLNLGSVITGDTSSSSIKVSNLGDTTLVLESATITGSVFNLLTDLPIEIAPGDSDNVVIQFTPEDTVSYNSILTIETNDYNSPEVEIVLLGQGSVPALASIPLDTLSFGYVLENTSAEQSFRIYNVGNTNLVVNSLTTYSGFYHILNIEVPFTIVPEQNKQIDVEFTPNQEGEYIDSLVISSNSYSGIEKVYLMGYGTPTPVPVITFINGNIDFGNVTPFESESDTITVKNTGTADLMLSEITLNNNALNIEYDMDISFLSPDSALAIEVAFAPQDTGEFQGYLTVSDNVNEISNYTTVTGYGAGAVLSADTLIDFGAIVLGGPKHDTLEIINNGNIDLEISNINVSGAGFELVSSSYLTIGANTYEEIVIKFYETSAGIYQGNLTWSDNAYSSTGDVELKGIIRAPEYSSALALDFGNVIVGQSSLLNLTIQNLGDTSLIIDNPDFSNSSFSTDTIFPLTIEKYDSESVQIYFTPEDTVSYNSILEFTTNEYRNTSVEIELLGNGIPPALALISTDSLNFGEVIEDSSKQLSFQMGNTGNTNLIIDSLNTKTNYFHVLNATLPFIIPPYQNRQLLVEFTPNTENIFIDSLTIISNSYSGVENLMLFGIGLPIPKPVITFIEGNIDFGNVTPLTSVTNSISLKNTGNKNLNLSNISLENFVFTFEYGKDITIIEPDSSLEIEITFSPDTIGMFQSCFIVTDEENDVSDSTLVQGGGAGALIDVDSQFSYNDIVVFSNFLTNVAVANKGNITLQINALVFKNQKFTSDLNLPYYISENLNSDIPIQLTLNDTTNVNDTLVIQSNSYKGDVEIVLDAQVVLPEIELSIADQKFDSLKFGSVRTVEDSTINISIKHSEGESYKIEIDSVAIFGNSASFFSCDLNLPFLLNYGVSQQISITYQPENIGEHTATYALFSNNLNIEAVGLYGEGILNQAPQIENVEPPTELSTHNIEISFQLSDPENDTLNLELEYFYNSWQRATLNNDYTNLIGQYYNGALTWISNSDLRGYYKDLHLRIIAADHFSAKDTSEFEIDLANLVGDLVYSDISEIGIGFEDIIPFADSWKTTGEIKNIGPASGEIPSVIPSEIPSEQVINFEDLCVFVQMWNWTAENLKSESLSKLAKTAIGNDFSTSFDFISKDTIDVYLSLVNSEARAFELFLPIQKELFEVISVSKAIKDDKIILFSFANESEIKLNLVNIEPKSIINNTLLISIRLLKKTSDDIINILPIYELRNVENESIASASINIIADFARAFPKEFCLKQNYPNPFNPITTITFGLPEDNKISLYIYNISGQLVRQYDGFYKAGYHNIIWDGVNNSGRIVASGVYIYYFKAGTYSKQMKMLLLK